MMPTFRERLRQPPLLLLDGATGTELNRRGVDTSLPLWSAAAISEAPDTLRKIHDDYIAAGAELVITNTFRTHERNLKASGFTRPRQAAADLTRRAVEIAREAADGRAWVAGSQAPLEDCYSPELASDDVALQREHRQMAQNLAAAGVDVILVETHNTIREAVAATRAAVETELPVLVSFVCGTHGRLLSGEPLAEAAYAVLAFSPDAVLVNCAPAWLMEQLLLELRGVCGDVPIGCYANIGEADPEQGWRTTDAEDPLAYAGFAGSWIAAGARLIGGCCGTMPRHVELMRERIAS